MFTHIIWDFDGTLFDTYPVMAETCRGILSKSGCDMTHREIMDKMKVSMSYAIEYFKAHCGVTPEMIRAYQQQVKTDERLHAKAFEGIPELLRAICDSGKKNYIYTHRGESCLELLRQSGLYEYFTDFIISTNGFERKPSPQALIYLADKHNMAPDETIMIGDRNLDIEAAKNAGLKGCYLNADAQHDNPLADFTIRDCSALYDILEIEG